MYLVLFNVFSTFKGSGNIGTVCPVKFILEVKIVPWKAPISLTTLWTIWHGIIVTVNKRNVTTVHHQSSLVHMYTTQYTSLSLYEQRVLQKQSNFKEVHLETYKKYWNNSKALFYTYTLFQMQARWVQGQYPIHCAIKVKSSPFDFMSP